jgi:hypothetical protein
VKFLVSCISAPSLDRTRVPPKFHIEVASLPSSAGANRLKPRAIRPTVKMAQGFRRLH